MAKKWGRDYIKHASATVVNEGKCEIRHSTHNEIKGSNACVVVPTIYTYKQDGKSTTEEGRMKFVLNSEAGAWKIRGWTGTGFTPYPSK